MTIWKDKSLWIYEIGLAVIFMIVAALVLMRTNDLQNALVFFAKMVIQAQLNTADDGASHGLYFGVGPTAALATGAPTAGVTHTPYTEGDVPILGGSATKDACGHIDWGASKGIKLAPAVGIGGFSGTSNSATLVGPSLGTIFGH